MLEDIDIRLDPPGQEETKNPFGAFAQSFMKNIDLKGHTRWALYAIKAEVTLNEFRFVVYWTSLIEMGLILVGIVLLMMAERYWVILHFLHLVRPIFALKLLSNLPRSHEIFEELPSMTDSSSMHPIILSHFKRGNRWMTRYAVLSIICFLFDLIGCIVSLAILNDRSNSDMFYGFMTWVFLCFDSLLIFWYNTLRWMYPDDIWQNVRSVVKGSLSEGQAFLAAFLRSVQDRFKR